MNLQAHAAPAVVGFRINFEELVPSKVDRSGKVIGHIWHPAATLMVFGDRRLVDLANLLPNPASFHIRNVRVQKETIHAV